jgi:8-oxo-dGTP pyrophosphatase MutT (NUDIX family)
LTHPGQVAFPGGRLDPEDVDQVAAALREAEEELGIPRAAPRILGRLDDLNTHTGFHVTPIVAVLPPGLVLVPSAGEVASTFTVPLAVLAEPRARRSVRVRRAGGREIRLHFWPEHGPVIWGVTGHILANLIDVIGP